MLRLADQHAPGRRAFAVEGAGSFGAGLARFLISREERVLEVGRLRRGRQSGKSDALDAIRAARSVLGQTRPTRAPRHESHRVRRCARRPRSGGEPGVPRSRRKPRCGGPVSVSSAPMSGRAARSASRVRSRRGEVRSPRRGRLAGQGRSAARRRSWLAAKRQAAARKRTSPPAACTARDERRGTPRPPPPSIRLRQRHRRLSLGTTHAQPQVTRCRQTILGRLLGWGGWQSR